MNPTVLRRAQRVAGGVLVGGVVAVAAHQLVLGGGLRPRVGPGNEMYGPGSPDESGFLTGPYPAPAFALTDQYGNRITEGSFPGKVRIIFFGYTHCPDICPMTLSRLARLLETLEPRDTAVQVLFVTVDPERDTPERLKAYLDTFGRGILGLTGPEEDIRRMASGFGAEFHRRGTGRDYAMAHTARLFVVDPKDRVRLSFLPTTPTSEVTTMLSRLLDEAGGDR